MNCINLSEYEWVFAFPGMGKTTLSKMNNRFIDIDGGDVRKVMGYEKGDERVFDFIKARAKLELAKGNIVLCNEPDLVDWAIGQGLKTISVLPLDNQVVAKRVLEREGPESDFARALQINIDAWVSDWKKKDILKVYANYLADLLKECDGTWISEEVKNAGKDILLSNVMSGDDASKEIYDQIRHLKLGFINKYIIINRNEKERSRLLKKWNRGGMIVHDFEYMLSISEEEGLTGAEAVLDSMWRYIWKNNNHLTHLVISDYHDDIDWMKTQGYTILDMDGEKGDVNMISVDEIENMLTRRTYISGSSNSTIIWKVDDEKRTFGNWVRWTVMNGVERYIGIGDEIESVDMRREAGVPGTHWNVKRAHIYDWDNIPNGEIIPPERESEGQAKLDAVDFPMLMEDCDTILIVGGSPGEHFSRYNFGMKKVINYDPRDMAAHPQIEHRQKLYDGWLPSDQFVFIMDIRSDSTNLKSKDGGIALDNILMRDYAVKAIKSELCVALSMKFRPSLKLKSWKFGFKAYIVFQPFVGSNSMETRLFWWRDRAYAGKEIVSTSLYKKKLRSWNSLRNRSVDNVQRRGIGELVIRTGDFTQEKGVFVSLFAASNAMNYVGKRNVLMDKLRDSGNLYIVMYPEANVSRFWNKRLGITFENGYMHDGDFIDRLETGFQEGYHTYNCNTLIWYLRKNNQIKGYPYNSSGLLTELWFFETNIIKDCGYQTLVNNQTHHVKYFTSAIREILNHDNETLHAVRRYILSLDKGVTPIDGALVNGYDTNKKMFISVAGHMVNMLLATHWTVIDLNRYMDTIENNVKGVYTDAATFEAQEKRVLWHSLDDWRYAVKTYELMAITLFNFVHKKEVTYVWKRLDSIYGALDLRRESNHAYRFRTSEEGIAMLDSIKASEV